MALLLIKPLLYKQGFFYELHPIVVRATFMKLSVNLLNDTVYVIAQYHQIYQVPNIKISHHLILTILTYNLTKGLWNTLKQFNYLSKIQSDKLFTLFVITIKPKDVNMILPRDLASE